MRVSTPGIIIALLCASLSQAQSSHTQVKEILNQTLQPREIVTYQLQEYLMRRAPQLPAPTSAAEWTAQAEKIRQHLVNEVFFHGWPRAWVDAPPRFENLGTVDSGKGYRRSKLRYEVVPGFYSTALLYEPESPGNRRPAVLAVMGHFMNAGKSVEFEQKLCINLALRGMVVLNLEWLGTGEGNNKESDHWFGASLDLVGMSGEGLFYLEMRRGLDILAANPHVDPARLGVTGLSGGGWQTITLSALDNRVYASIPVAGYASLPDRLPHPDEEVGDFEQEPTDFLVGQDYPTLTAMRAPRPTLLINNAEDGCCYRAPVVKPDIFDAVKPFFALYGKPDAFEFHENTDPGDHNYDLDNRQQAYRFFAKAFGLPVNDQEIPVDDQVRSYDELAAGLPAGNLTILGLARKQASEITRPPIPADAAARAAWADAERKKLKALVRFDPVEVREVWRLGNTKHKGFESLWFRFEMNDGLSATGIWIKAIATPGDAPLTVVLDDKGLKAAGEQEWSRLPWVADLVERGQQVLVLELVFTGNAAPKGQLYPFSEGLGAVGRRALGVEAAQLIALAHWAGGQWKPRQVRLETTGLRSQVEGWVAAAIEPRLFSGVVSYAGMESLRYLLDAPVPFLEAPDMFCLDLYKEFDLDRLAAIAGPASVIRRENLKLASGAEPAAGAPR